MLVRDTVPSVDSQLTSGAALARSMVLELMPFLERITSTLSVRDLRDPQRGGLS